MTDEVLVEIACGRCGAIEYYELDSLPGGEEHCPYCADCGELLLVEVRPLRRSELEVAKALENLAAGPKNIVEANQEMIRHDLMRALLTSWRTGSFAPAFHLVRFGETREDEDGMVRLRATAEILKPADEE